MERQIEVRVWCLLSFAVMDGSSDSNVGGGHRHRVGSAEAWHTVGKMSRSKGDTAWRWWFPLDIQR